MAKKYIETDILKEFYEPYSNRGLKIPVDVILANIDDMPAADVVEVVRCRECRYREEEQPGMVYCPNTVGGWVDEDWFCAGGERRDG